MQLLESDVHRVQTVFTSSHVIANTISSDIIPAAAAAAAAAL